jgi:ABC-2 type transport system permease protein
MTVMDERTATFASTVRSEWDKLTSLRSARRNLVLGVVFGVTLSVGVAFISGLTYKKWDDAGRADFDPLLYPATGAILTVLFFATVGVNVLAAEYRTGMIRTTFTATPNRAHVLFAKAAAVSIATTAAGLLVTAGMYGGSHLVYTHYGLPTADLWSSAGLRVLGFGVATTAVFPILALCVTVFTRSTAPALTATLIVMFAPSIIGGVLPRWWQEHVLVLLPGIASDALTVGHITGADQYLHSGLAGTIVIGWVIGALVAGTAALEKRDA